MTKTSIMVPKDSNKAPSWISLKGSNCTQCCNAPKACPSLSDVTASHPTCHKLDSDESDEEEDYLEDILNFGPFQNALNKPIVRRNRKL